jgi:hypothetical protein
MDWETLLAFAGIYILLIGTFAHFVNSVKRLFAHDEKILKMVISNQKAIEEIKNHISNKKDKGKK